MRSTTPCSPNSARGNQSSLNLENGQTVLLKWDLSYLRGWGITSRSQILGARVIVFIDQLRNLGTLEVHRLCLPHSSATPWGEATATWNNAPLIYSSPETGTLTLINGTYRKDDFLALDVTNLVRDWVDGSQPNCGLALVASMGLDLGLVSKEAAEGFGSG